MCSKASPVNLVCDIVLRKYVFSPLKADTFLSHSHVVTDRVEKNLKHSVMLGYIPESISFKVAATVAGRGVLGSPRSHFLWSKLTFFTKVVSKLWHLDVFNSHFRWSGSPKTLNDPKWLTRIAEYAQIAREILFWSTRPRRSCDGVTAVGRLVNFAASLERVYDPFLFLVLGIKESIKKGKTIFAIQLAVYIYQKYIQCRFIYLFVLYSEISDSFPETGGNRYGSAPGLDSD